MLARWIYFRIARDLTQYSHVEIGGNVGRDHASVTHGLKYFDRDIWEDSKWRELYCRCLSLLTEIELPEIPQNTKSIEGLLSQISDLQERFNQYKREVFERDNHERPILEIYREMDQEQKERLLFQAKTLLKVGRVMQKRSA